MDELRSLADEYLDFTLRTDAMGGLWDGNMDNIEVWPRFAPEAVEEERRVLRDIAARAEALDVPRDDKAAYALKETIRRSASAAADAHQWTAEIFSVAPQMGLVEMVFSFVDNYRLVTAAHGESYLVKMRRLPGVLEELADTVTQAARDGRVTIASHLLGTADRIDAYLATPAGPDERLCSQAPPVEIDPAAQRAWADSRDAIIADAVRPALARFAVTLRTVAEYGRDDTQPGLCHLPCGIEVYAHHVRMHTQLDYTPEQIHQIGLDKIAALEDEYREIAGPLFGTTDIDEIYRRLREDTSLTYTSADAIVRDAEAAVARATLAAGEYFSRLPKSSCDVIATPYGAMGYYSQPQPDTGKQGAYYINTAHPEAWATYELEAISFHEAIPGHHLQLALHVEDDALHKLQRTIYNTAYAEGWGLYTERLADEMGLYSSDMDRVGMLSADSLRACRLVVDTGIHALGWTRQQAIDYVMAHSPMDEGHVAAEIDRYISLPGQAVSYMLGRIELESIRAAAEAKPDFDIRAFHDDVLRYGAVALPTLRELILDD